MIGPTTGRLTVECQECGLQTVLEQETKFSGLVLRTVFCMRCELRFETVEKIVRVAGGGSLDVLPLDRDEMERRWGQTCQKCGSTQNLQWDHIRPESHGYRRTVDNLQRLCAPCNQSKGARHQDYRSPEQTEWAQDKKRVQILGLKAFKPGEHRSLNPAGFVIGGEGGAIRLRDLDLVPQVQESQPQKLLTRVRVGRGRGDAKSYDPMFEAIWQGCPDRRGNKWPAFKAWEKFKVSADVICPVYTKWCETDQWQRGFVPHLSTWLNQRGWETEPGPGEFKAPDDGRSAPVASIDVRRESFREQAALAARLARIRSDLGGRARPAPLGAAASDVVRQLADSKEIA